MITCLCTIWAVCRGTFPVHTVKNSSITTKHLYLILTFRSHHEIFVRKSWYSVLPSLDATISCRIKKAVVGVTQLITALVSIHSSMTFVIVVVMDEFLTVLLYQPNEVSEQ